MGYTGSAVVFLVGNYVTVEYKWVFYCLYHYKVMEVWDRSEHKIHV